MIRAGISTPQQVTVTGTDFIATAIVLVTPPGASSPLRVVPISATTTVVIFAFVFDEPGDYTIIVADATGQCDACASSPFTLSLVADADLGARFDAPQTLGLLRAATRHRLGDDGSIWPDDEIDRYLREGYTTAATALRIFWDQTYAENLPGGFSLTQPWERQHLNASGRFDAGVANFTAEFERRAWGDERQRIGPGNHTSPFEATDGLLARANASPAIPATSELPPTLTALDRVLWDTRLIEPLEPRTFERLDSRYETTTGEVYGYLWQKDGVRTLRKVRVPAAQAATVTVNGSWGLCRDVADVCADTPDGTWGIVRQVPTVQPLGPETFGVARRFFLDGMNVRVEHFRQGRAMRSAEDACELPPRYARYLLDFAQGRCLSRPGPGFDEALGQLFLQKWARGLARIARRVALVDTEHVHVMGGNDGARLSGRPPRPRLPWAYGSSVR